MWRIRIHTTYKIGMEHICHTCVTNVFKICDEFVRMFHTLWRIHANNSHVWKIRSVKIKVQQSSLISGFQANSNAFITAYWLRWQKCYTFIWKTGFSSFSLSSIISLIFSAISNVTAPTVTFSRKELPTFVIVNSSSWRVKAFICSYIPKS